MAPIMGVVLGKNIGAETGQERPRTMMDGASGAHRISQEMPTNLRQSMPIYKMRPSGNIKNFKPLHPHTDGQVARDCGWN